MLGKRWIDQYYGTVYLTNIAKIFLLLNIFMTHKFIKYSECNDMQKLMLESDCKKVLNIKQRLLFLFNIY